MNRHPSSSASKGRLFFRLAVLILLAALAVLVWALRSVRSEKPEFSSSAIASVSPAAVPLEELPPVLTPLPSETPQPLSPAEQVPLHFSSSRRESLDALSDGNYRTMWYPGSGKDLQLSADRPFSRLYIVWYYRATPTELVSNGTVLAAAGESYLMEVIELPKEVTELSFRLSEPNSIADIYAFTEGELPDWVHCWQPPLAQADLLLFPTHSDDEFVFFGGLIPAYINAGYGVQVVYQVDHRHTDPQRSHELLNSLWEAGIRNYPVINDNKDYYFNTMEETEAHFNTDDALLAFQTEQIRRFRPLVVVGHAEDGESHHPAHQLNVRCLKEAILAAGNPEQFPSSAAVYGTWDTPKTYLHLYGPQETRTLLDYETPLAGFQFRTAFEVAEDSFRLCVSQFEKGKYHVYGSGSIYDSHAFGLYRSLVGPDEQRNDLLEHLDPDSYPRT